MDNKTRKKIGWFEIIIIVIMASAVAISYWNTYYAPNFSIEFSEEEPEEEIIEDIDIIE